MSQISRSKDVDLKRTFDPPRSGQLMHTSPRSRSTRRSCVIMIILLMSFVGDLVCVHVIHDVRTYGEVQIKIKIVWPFGQAEEGHARERFGLRQTRRGMYTTVP
jgi:hypothetical protein